MEPAQSQFRGGFLIYTYTYKDRGRKHYFSSENKILTAHLISVQLKLKD